MSFLKKFWLSGNSRGRFLSKKSTRYPNPKKIKKGSLNYNKFSGKDLFLVKRAWEYIKTYDMKTKAAFKRAENEFNDPQMALWR